MKGSNRVRLETVSDFFQRDHREIDGLFLKADVAAGAGAAAAFEAFDRRLERHIRWEEEALFPAAARALPQLEHGPIAVMLVEHREIRDCKAGALAALRRGDIAGARGLVQRLQDVLVSHNMKEERILYPACDEALGAEERSALFARLAQKPA